MNTTSQEVDSGLRSPGEAFGWHWVLAALFPSERIMPAIKTESPPETERQPRLEWKQKSEDASHLAGRVQSGDRNHRVI